MNQKEIETIVTNWEKDEPVYSNLCKIVDEFIKKEITEYEILPKVSSRPKELPSIIKKIIKKRAQGEKDYSYNSLTDKAGARIICQFKSELSKVKEFIYKYFIVEKFESKSEKLPYNELDYVSDHYDLKIKNEVPFFKKHGKYKNLVFEIQARTINQNAWADGAHALVYKQENKLDDKTKRRIFRLISLYELADDEFDSINNYLMSSEDYPAYSILKKLEGKFYKYAKTNFDKELSVINIKNLILTFDTPQEQAEKMKISFDKFINTNEEKIKKIFEEQNLSFNKNIFLSQPEIFFIWYLIENFEFTIKEHWQKFYSLEDLNNIAIWWGKSLD